MTPIKARVEESEQRYPQPMMSVEKFDGHKYVNLETFRGNGEGVRTPLWFAEENGVLYARTFEKTGKARGSGGSRGCA